MPPLRGTFITIEGGEGVGKSTLLKGLAEFLLGHGHQVATTREPGGTPTANAIRSLFARSDVEEPLLPMTELMLVSAARHQHVELLIKPKLRGGVIVISDRYTDSTRVYQGAVGGIDRETLEKILQFSTSALEPDITFLLDCSAEESAKRVKERGQQAALEEGVERYDSASMETHRRIRQGFLDLSVRFPRRIFKIDAGQSSEMVLADALSHLRDRGIP